MIVASSFGATGCDPVDRGSQQTDSEAACPEPRKPFVRQAWTTDDSIEAIAVHCETIYVAGAFESIGPRTGPLGSVSLSGGSAPEMPRLWSEQREDVTTPPARVTSLLGDGTGGWYVAGSFDFVGDRRCPGIVHALSTGRVDPAICFGTDGTVRAMAVVGDVLYLGGDFTRVHGVHRVGIAAVDRRTGSVLPWAPSLNARSVCDDHDCATGASVNSLAVSPSAVYVGGFFNGVGHVARANVAALDSETGALLPFDAGIRAEEDYFGQVEALALSDGLLYFSCPYCNERGSREPLHGVDAESGRHEQLIAVDGSVTVLKAYEGTIYAGGSFGRIVDARRTGVAALDASSGDVLPWSPVGLPLGTSVDALAKEGNVVYLGTRAALEENRDSSTSVQGFRIAPFDAKTGRARSSGSFVNESVLALVASQRFVVAGGNFSGVNVVRRDGLAAIDGTRGVVLEWAPRTGRDPWEHPRSLLVAGERLYVGGSLTEIDGVARRGLASFDLGTRKVTSWSPRVRGIGDPFFDGVVSLAERDGTIYAGGDFTEIDGETRRGAAAIHAESGEVLDWNPGVGPDPMPRIEQGAVKAVAVDDGRVLIGGEFEDVAGEPRAGLAAVDDSSGALEDWSPEPSDYSWISTILPSDGDAYVGGWFGAIGGASRIAVALVEDDGDASEFDAHLDTGSIHGPVLALARAGDQLFIVGNFEVVDGLKRAGLAALDATSGRLLDWNLDPADRACSPTSLALGGSALVVDGYIDGCGDYEYGNVEQLVVYPVPKSS